MATRLWPLPITQATCPAVSAGWNVSASAGQRKLSRVPLVDNSSASPNLAGTGSANQNRLVWRLVSDPIAAQTFGGTLKGQFRCLETNAGVDQYFMQLRAMVWSNDVATLRGVLVELHTNALSSEFVASLTNRAAPLAALSPAAVGAVVALSGDRIAIELGFRQASTAVANAQIQLRDQNASDLPEDEASTSAFNGWFEFSQTIAFLPPGAGSSRLVMPQGLTLSL